MTLLALILILLPAIHAQNDTSTLALSQDYAVTLQPERTYFFELQLPA